jgi:glycosyltransferase involved in cell wall biosynthesis
MHITIFIGGLSGGGAERVVCNLSNFLSLRGASVKIITMSDDKPYEELSDKISRDCLINQDERRNFLQDSILRYQRLKKIIRENPTDVYLVLLPITIFFLLSMRKKVKAPVIVSERNNPKSYSFFIKFLLKYYCRKANAFVFQTEGQKKWYSNMINLHNKKIEIIPNAVNNKKNKIKSKEDDCYTIISAGRLSPQKNFKILINAFAQVHKKCQSYKLTIWGDGVLRDKLERQIKTLHLEGYVSLPGFSKNINEEMGKASMFVLSSNYEGIPNALIEAMQNGLPCISTDCDGGGARLLINNGVNGILVEKGNVSALADAMIKIGENEEFAMRLGLAARESLEVFAPEVIYKKWESFIFRVINAHK